MPKISVIIPVYNAEKYIAETLDSVLAQTFNDIEIICIDDGSTDGSIKILEKYQKKDKRIKIIKQKNQGVIVARNNAIKQAKGEFIYPLDSDNIIDKTTLEKSHNAIIAGKDDIITCRVWCFGEENEEMPLPRPNKRNMAFQNCLVNAALFRKSLFDKSGGFDPAFNKGLEDYDFWLNMVYKQKAKIYRIPEILFFYRIKPVNESRNEQQKTSCNDELMDMLNVKYPEMKKYRKLRNIMQLMFQIRYKESKVIVGLFRLPILKIKDRCKFYLLGFFPLFRIKSKYEKKTLKLFSIIPICSFKPRKKYNIYKLFGVPVFFTKKTNIFDRYNQHIMNLKNKEKIRVGFLVWENSKWSYDSLYKKLAADKRFEPVVVMVLENHSLCNIGKNRNFFKKYNYCIVKDINDFARKDIDIVFYEQPWFALEGDFMPKKISKYALTLYVPYAIQMDADNLDIVSACTPFYQSVYKSFMFNDIILSNFAAHNITNMLAVGHPKLDTYLQKDKPKTIKPTSKLRIVYAPHHSFANSPLKWATWEWNGNHILDLARNNQDKTEWIFKPHPRFKLELANLLGSEEKAQQVFDDWANVATIYDKGDYFDLFKSADLMISDCGSFILEWLPTEKPYIHLLSQNPNASPFSETTKYYSSQYYKCKDLTDLDKYFDMIVKQHKDPNKRKRISVANDVPLGATQKIYGFVKGLIQ